MINIKIEISNILTKDFGLNVFEDSFLIPYQSFGLDSLDFIELCIIIENKFDIIIQDEELAKCNTLQDVVDLIKRIKDQKL